jgi:hypothetical protein
MEFGSQHFIAHISPDDHSTSDFQSINRITAPGRLLADRYLIPSGAGAGHGPREVTQQVSDGLVGDRINPHVAQLLLQSRVPVILDVIVRSARKLGSYQGPSAISYIADKIQ